MEVKKLLKIFLLILAVVGLMGFYHHYDPAKASFFPKCPFKTASGYDCPGCGSQQAIHNLLNFQIIAAMKANLLLILAIPFAIVFFVIDNITNPSPAVLRLKNQFFQTKYIWAIVVVVMIFWIIRNLITTNIH